MDRIIDWELETTLCTGPKQRLVIVTRRRQTDLVGYNIAHRVGVAYGSDGVNREYFRASVDTEDGITDTFECRLDNLRGFRYE